MWRGCAILCLHRAGDVDKSLPGPKVEANTKHVNLSASGRLCWCQAIVMDKVAQVLRSTCNMVFSGARKYLHRDGTGTGNCYGIDGDRDRIKANGASNLLTCGLGRMRTSRDMTIRTIQIAGSTTHARYTGWPRSCSVMLIGPLLMADTA